ncbi:hypothetical protein ACFY93_30875 [Streptomyces sp. NPDC008313]|uniref:hypothetical protein n=1 Tax=Streptomyces sp. NPDC008313 TaxID=3364826 RepID=UPI0036EB0E21
MGSARITLCTLGAGVVIATAVTPALLPTAYAGAPGVSTASASPGPRHVLAPGMYGTAPARAESASVAPAGARGSGTAADHASVETHEDGPGTWQTVVGLVLAAVAAIAVAVRSVRRGRGDD